MDWYPSIDIDTTTGVITGNNSGSIFDPGTEYVITSVASGRALDVDQQSTANSANVQLWSY